MEYKVWNTWSCIFRMLVARDSVLRELRGEPFLMWSNPGMVIEHKGVYHARTSMTQSKSVILADLLVIAEPFKFEC